MCIQGNLILNVSIDIHSDNRFDIRMMVDDVFLVNDLHDRMGLTAVSI